MSETIKHNRWYVVVNPLSGRGKGLKDFPVINSLLLEAGIEFDANFTLRKYHAVEMTFKAIEEGYRRIIVVGGDGTLHEVVTGVMMQKFCATVDVTIAVLAVGTGNDWVRMYGVPKNYSEVVRSIVSGRTFLQDVGRVTYYESMVKQEAYLCNAGGVAYDAYVSKRVNRLKSKGYKGAWLYILSGAREFMRPRRARVQILSDGKEVFNGKMFSSTIGIGRYNGGGLAQTPLAVVDDGLFDVTVIPHMNLVKMLFRLRSIYRGNIYNIKGVRLYRGSNIQMICDKEIPMELDGEDCGVSDFTFEMLPQAIKVIVSENFDPTE